MSLPTKRRTGRPGRRTHRPAAVNNAAAGSIFFRKGDKMRLRPQHKADISEALQGAGVPNAHSGHILDLLEAIVSKGPQIGELVRSLIDLVKSEMKPKT